MTRDASTIAAVDVLASELEAEAACLNAQRQVNESVAKLRYILAHPGEFAQPAPAGLRAEYSHLLHDADTDSTVPAFVDLNKGTPGRTS